MAATAWRRPRLPDPGGVPHYFGPYGNWAFSPLPKGPVATVTVVDGGTGYSATPMSPSTMRTWRRAHHPPMSRRRLTVLASLPASRSVERRRRVHGSRRHHHVTPTGTGAPRHAPSRSIGGTLTAAFASSSTRCRAWGPREQTTSASTSRLRVPEPCTLSGQAADCYYDRPGRVRGEDALGPARDQAPGLRAAVDSGSSWRNVPLFNPDGTPIMMPDGAPRRSASTTPITWGPSSSPRAG